MEWALYCPVYGYYEKEADTLGRRGDYYTSVSVGPLFGELLALQLAGWLEGMPPGRADRPVQIIEAGAHRGDLARDILSWLRQQRPEVFARLEYWIVEPSDTLRRVQGTALAEFEKGVCWAKALGKVGQEASEIRRHAVTGVILSNELFDAMPVHRFGWDASAKAWFEWGVMTEDERFVWTRLDRASVEPPVWPGEILEQLADGFTVEMCPAAAKWWEEAAGLLELGKLVTIDYGLTSEEWLSPERPGGTLRAYRRQKIVGDVLADPGEQDITAHVNFSALAQAGEAAGLTTEGLLTQEQFLTRIAVPIFENKAKFGPWTKERTRQFQSLTHPEHLGRSFRVLIQSRP